MEFICFCYSGTDSETIFYVLYIADVIGQVVEVSNVEVVAVNGKDTNKIALQIRDSE